MGQHSVNLGPVPTVNVNTATPIMPKHWCNFLRNTYMCCSHFCRTCDFWPCAYYVGSVRHFDSQQHLKLLLNHSDKSEINKSSKRLKVPKYWTQCTRFNFMMLTGHSYVTFFRSGWFFNCFISVNFSMMQHIVLWSEAQKYKGRSSTRVPVSAFVMEEHPSNLFPHIWSLDEFYKENSKGEEVPQLNCKERK